MNKAVKGDEVWVVKMIIGYKAVNPSCDSKTPYLRSKFLIWRTANILQQSRLLGRLNKNAVESVVDGIPCTSFQTHAVTLHLEIVIQKRTVIGMNALIFRSVQIFNVGEICFTFDNFEINCSVTSTNNLVEVLVR